MSLDVPDTLIIIFDSQDDNLSGFTANQNVFALRSDEKGPNNVSLKAIAIYGLLHFEVGIVLWCNIDYTIAVSNYEEIHKSMNCNEVAWLAIVVRFALDFLQSLWIIYPCLVS